MGPRKRSKPNPKAETEPASEEAPLPKGPVLQTEQSSKPTFGESVPSNKPEGVEYVDSAGNGADTVSSRAHQLVQNETNLF